MQPDLVPQGPHPVFTFTDSLQALPEGRMDDPIKNKNRQYKNDEDKIVHLSGVNGEPEAEIRIGDVRQTIASAGYFIEFYCHPIDQFTQSESDEQKVDCPRSKGYESKNQTRQDRHGKTCRCQDPETPDTVIFDQEADRITCDTENSGMAEGPH